MKKIILLALASVFASVSVMAQDMAQATETYNNGAMSLQMGDKTAALASFRSALSEAQNCGDEGAELVDKCKEVIPSIMLSIGKETAAEKNYDEAISQISEAATVAEEYGNADVKTEATTLISQLRAQKANTLLQAKDYAGATAAYKEAIADDPDNGTLYIRLGSALNAAGDTDEAIEAFKKASELGETDNAAKQLSTLYLKKAQASLKAQKYQDTINECEESISYKENANAYKIAASAATKLSKNADAIAYYEKYLAAAPNANDASGIMMTVAVLYQQQGNKAKAIEYYQKIANDPKFGEQAQAQLKALQ